MNVFRNLESLPEFQRAVITIGTFDGVHVGHRQIIQQLLNEAGSIHGTPILITFFPHPKQVIESTKKPLFILNTPEEKFELLQNAGIQNIVVVPFTKKFADQSAISYIRDFLVERFHPHTIIIGYDHRFGRDRAGDYHLLEDEADKYGYNVKEIPEHVIQNVTISSTRIREALLAGDMERANNFLGYNYFISGVVMEGNKLGRTIGYPTANLKIMDEQKLIPANGVYAVRVNVEGIQRDFIGMMNIGTRPTVNGTGRMIEVNIFDFSAFIYGKTVKIGFVKRLRNEEKFSGLQALKTQLLHDKEQALSILK